MKKKIKYLGSIFYICFFLSSSMFGQNVNYRITLGTDAMLLNNGTYAATNFQNITWLGSGAYLKNYVISQARGLVNFDRCQLPQGVTNITRATLRLTQVDYAGIDHAPNNGLAGHNTTNNSNHFVQGLSPAIDPTIATWANFVNPNNPIGNNRVSFIANRANAFVDIDVTAMVQNMITNNPTNMPFSFLLQSANETLVNWTTFGSFETAEATRPVLTINATPPACQVRNNLITAQLVTPEDLNNGNACAYVGNAFTYTMRLSNLDCFDLNNLLLSLDNLPFGAGNLTIGQVTNDNVVGAIVNGRPAGQISVNANGTINLPANSSGTLSFTVTYTQVSTGDPNSPFCQRFNLQSPQLADATRCYNQTISTCGEVSNYRVHVLNGCPAAMSCRQENIANGRLAPIAVSSSLSFHNTLPKVKSFKLDFSYDPTILSYTNYTPNAKLTSVGAIISTNSITQGKVVYTVTIPTTTRLDFGDVDATAPSTVTIGKNEAIITPNFSMIKFPTCMTTINVNRFEITNGTNTVPTRINTDPGQIGVVGNAACPALNAAFTTSTPNLTYHKINTPVVFTASDAIGFHYWRIGGSNGFLLASTANIANWTFTQSGDYVIEHTISKNGTISISSQTIRVYNARVLTIGADAWLGSRYPTSNFGTYPLELPVAYTPSGNQYGRSLIKFNFCEMPVGTIIQDANLSLKYANNVSSSGFTTHTGSANTCVLKRVTSAWTESTVTWGTQPTVVATNSVTFGGPASTNQSFVVPVKNLVNDIVQNGTNNGLQLALNSETPTNNMVFGSFNNVDPLLRPRMEVVFWCPNNNCNVCNPNARTDADNEVTVQVDDLYTKKMALNASPNPFDNVINLGFELESDNKVGVSVFDANGNKIQDNNYSVFSRGINSIELHFDANVNAGVYLVKVNQNNNSETVKIIKK